MIMKICSDANQRLRYLDPVPLELLRVTDSREHQKLRGVDGSRAENHFPTRFGTLQAAAVKVADSRCTTGYQVYPKNMCVLDDPEVRAR